MYSLADQLHRHIRGLLLVCAALAAISLVSQGQDSWSSGAADLLPCVYKGVPYRHVDSWDVDECTTCYCHNATVTCVTESCPLALCPSPIRPEGECCFLCPFNVEVKKVLPEISSNNTISEGGDNSLRLRVSVEFNERKWLTRLQGEGLYRLSAWASPNPDGTGAKFGLARNVLTEEQMSQHYKLRENFQFADVKYDFNDSRAQCDDLLYICTRINKGDNPITKGGLEYQFTGLPNETAQVGCTGAPECKESFSISSGNGQSDLNELPCVFRGAPYMHGESWDVDECTTCDCYNATTTCFIERCPSALCSSPIKPEGTCCSSCPCSCTRPAEYSLVCEGSILELSCGGGKSISILEASYGRTAGAEVCPHPSIHDLDCHASNSLSILRAQCDGRSSCAVTANNGVFGDPCYGTYKYLEVTYDCVEPSRVCEGSSLQLSCGGGKSISILGANYGRTAGGEVCPHPSIRDLDCHASNSLDILRAQCDGSSSCAVSATNDVFGDPCYGTYKYLEVTYDCN